MQTVLVVIQVLLAIALVGVVLVQRSEGGGLGMGGQGGMGGFLSGRGQANLLTRTTAAIAALFMLTSLALALVTRDASRPASILEGVEVPATGTTTTTTDGAGETQGSTEPTVPLAE